LAAAVILIALASLAAGGCAAKPCRGYGNTGTLLRAERIHLALLSECLERRIVCRYEGALARTDLRGLAVVHETGEWSVWPLPLDPREELVPKEAVLVRFALAPPPSDLCLVGDQDPDSPVPELGCNRREFIRLIALRAESPDVLEYLPPSRSPP
jgi:hypothetical protein